MDVIMKHQQKAAAEEARRMAPRKGPTSAEIAKELEHGLPRQKSSKGKMLANRMWRARGETMEAKLRRKLRDRMKKRMDRSGKEKKEPIILIPSPLLRQESSSEFQM